MPKQLARSPLFTVEQRDRVTLLRFSHHESLAGTELPVIRELWSFLADQEKRPSKVLVIEAPTNLLTTKNLDSFWAKLRDRHEEVSLRMEGPTSVARLSALREENAFCHFIEYLHGIDAFVVLVLQGEIDLPFLGLALAGDYRIAADDAVFVSRCLDVGMPPVGALSWYLTRFLGQGKAAQILMSSRSIPANEALELTLVNEVVPLEDLEASALRTAESFASKPTQALVAMKRSLAAAQLPLADYLREESRIAERCLMLDEQWGP